MITIKKFQDYNKIREYWGKMYENNPRLSIYQSIEYTDYLWKHILPYKFILRKKPIFYLFLDNNQPILLVPLYRDWFSSQAVLFGYKTGCGYLDIICDDAITMCQFDQCLQLLSRDNSISKIQFCHVRENSVLAEYIRQKSVEIGQTDCIEIDICDTYEEYHSQLSKNTRQNLRTAYNRLNNDEKNMEFQFYTSSTLTKTIKDSVLDLYYERQTQQYHKSNSFIFKFFLKHIDIGTLNLNNDDIENIIFTVHIDGKLAAFYAAIVDKDRVIVPRLAIADEFGRYSPGMILINESIKFFHQDSKLGIRYIDLTHGDEKYKKALGGSVHHCYQGQLRMD